MTQESTQESFQFPWLLLREHLDAHVQQEAGAEDRIRGLGGKRSMLKQLELEEAHELGPVGFAPIHAQAGQTR